MPLLRWGWGWGPERTNSKGKEKDTNPTSGLLLIRNPQPCGENPVPSSFKSAWPVMNTQ